MKNIIFIDAESDGLYGNFISVAMLVADSNGNELKHFYYGLKKELLKGVKTQWVIDNVLPIMGDYEVCNSETEMFEKVWNVWLKYKDNSCMVADIAYPVETRLLRECVALSNDKDAFSAPFPLFDLSSMLYAKGIDPLISRYDFLGLKSNDKQHNALEDVRISLKVWKKLEEK